MCDVRVYVWLPHHPFRHHKLSQRHFDVYFAINNHFSSFFCSLSLSLGSHCSVVHDGVWEREFPLWHLNFSFVFFCCPFSHYSLKMQSKQRFCNVMTCLCQVNSLSVAAHTQRKTFGWSERAYRSQKASANETFVNGVPMNHMIRKISIPIFRITRIFPANIKAIRSTCVSVRVWVLLFTNKQNALNENYPRNILIYTCISRIHFKHFISGITQLWFNKSQTFGCFTRCHCKFIQLKRCSPYLDYCFTHSLLLQAYSQDRKMTHEHSIHMACCACIIFALCFCLGCVQCILLCVCVCVPACALLDFLFKAKENRTLLFSHR